MTAYVMWCRMHNISDLNSGRIMMGQRVRRDKLGRVRFEMVWSRPVLGPWVGRVDGVDSWGGSGRVKNPERVGSSRTNRFFFFLKIQK
jgi:hypothetical protein